MPNSRPAILVALILLLGAYSLVVFADVQPRNAIEHFDLWYQIDRGNEINLSDPRTLSDGFYPLGYPLLLRAAIAEQIDVLRFSQFLSWLGGAFVLIAVFAISLSLARSVALALALCLLLAANSNFLQHASIESTDMLAAGLQLLSVLALWRADIKAGRRKDAAWLAAAGGLLGCAYLVRYTALVLLPCELAYAIWASGGRSKRAVAMTATLAAAFALSSAIQTVPSLLVHGQPFYNWQSKNVWFGIYGQGDWVVRWRTVPDDVSLLTVIGLDPAAFLAHWWTEFSRAFASPTLWQWPLHAAWLIGAVGLLLDRRTDLARRSLLLSVLLLPIAATALAWLDPRVMLVGLAMQAIPMAWLAGRIVSLIPRQHAVASLWLGTTLLAVFVPDQQVALAALLNAHPPTSPERVNMFLRSAGMSDPRSVVTNDPYLHATDMPARTRYSQAYFSVSNPGTVEAMLSDAEIARRQFLVLTREQVYGDYRAVIALAPQSKALVPLALNPTESIYCIMPCLFADMTPDDFVFANGMRLLAHRIGGRADRVTAYFYWQADEPLSRSYKISARILAADGARIAQVDRVPQIWTYPTTHWLPRETVVDFYELNTTAACGTGCRLALIVYDEQTGQPVRSLGSGAPDDQVVTWPLE